MEILLSTLLHYKKMESVVKAPADLEKEIKDQMLATIYGQAVGDAIGLLTEFMTKEEAIEVIPYNNQIFFLNFFVSLCNESNVRGIHCKFSGFIKIL